MSKILIAIPMAFTIYLMLEIADQWEKSVQKYGIYAKIMNIILLILCAICIVVNGILISIAP